MLVVAVTKKCQHCFKFQVFPARTRSNCKETLRYLERR